MEIFTVRQLMDVCPEIAHHVQRHDDELPTFSVEELRKELPLLVSYVLEANRGNYVPAYHGCGLLSRVLSLAQRKGHHLAPQLFWKTSNPEFSTMRWSNRLFILARFRYY